MATQVIFDDIVGYLRKEGWSFGISADNMIKLKIEGKNAVFDVYISLRGEKEIITIYLEYPRSIPGNRTDEMRKLVDSINWGLHFLTCEYNALKGKIRFRSFMLIDDAPFIEGQFATMIATAFSLADKYSNAINKVLEGATYTEDEMESPES